MIRRHVEAIVVREIRNLFEVPDAQPEIGNRATQRADQARPHTARTCDRVGDERPGGKAVDQLHLLAAHRTGGVHQDVGVGALDGASDVDVGTDGDVGIAVEVKGLIDAIVARVTVAGKPPAGPRALVCRIGHAVAIGVDQVAATRL